MNVPLNMCLKYVVFKNDRECGKLAWKTGNDIILGVVPFHHPLGLVGVAYQVLMQRATLVTLPHWELKRVLKVCKTYKAMSQHLDHLILFYLHFLYLKLNLNNQQRFLSEYKYWCGKEVVEAISGMVRASVLIHQTSSSRRQIFW